MDSRQKQAGMTDSIPPVNGYIYYILSTYYA